MPLNKAPACLEESCLDVSLRAPAYPYAAATAMASGFVVPDPAGLSYEFGVLHGQQMVPEATGLSVPHYTFTTLAAGNTSIYVCVVDDQGARACSSQAVSVEAPADGTISHALASIMSGDAGSTRNEPAAAVCRARILAAAAASLPDQGFSLASTVEESTAELVNAAEDTTSVALTMQVQSRGRVAGAGCMQGLGRLAASRGCVPPDFFAACTPPSGAGCRCWTPPRASPPRTPSSPPLRAPTCCASPPTSSASCPACPPPSTPAPRCWRSCRAAWAAAAPLTT